MSTFWEDYEEVKRRRTVKPKWRLILSAVSVVGLFVAFFNKDRWPVLEYAWWLFFGFILWDAVDDIDDLIRAGREVKSEREEL
ncbi:membrane protein [Gordonia phage Biskit]|uniref:Uncharacterized protein n=4 Tax=Emalynvirus troje TaxID=2560511 RepID=A0A2K9VEQ4_9CAUD|nr:hypothetical protein FDJ27_gp47 [Gordonia phage Troje]AXH45145.1 hypothetical protein SEA_SKETCHMEX_45 [Gordonia phage SketchMex]QNJ59477.1 hypothetical protein SEA_BUTTRMLKDREAMS_47 [Gordonia phage Buttrmlkdreams]QWY84920.1 hypothetical protein SEA_MSCARN_49 [Gordonia phage MScarn]UVK62086.1 membrane protein [Gordonia phage Biskit]AUV60752.1 hypothetical protein SEA_TROJE_47 [Gordonia phage Troje]